MKFSTILLVPAMAATAMAAPTPNKSDEVVCTPKIKGFLTFAWRVHIHTNKDFDIASEASKKWGHKMLKIHDERKPTHEVIVSECTGGSAPKKEKDPYGETVFGTIEFANERGKCLWHGRDGDKWPIGVADCPSKNYQKDDMWFHLSWLEDEEDNEDNEADVSIVDPKTKEIFSGWGGNEEKPMITMRKQFKGLPRASKPYVRVVNYKNISE